MMNKLTNENRFYSVKELIILSPTNPDTRVTHRVEEFGGRVQSKSPSRRETGLAAGADALDLLERGLRWYDGYRQDAAVKSYTDQVEGQFGLGEEGAVVVSSPGYDGERVEVSLGPPPDVMHAPWTPIRIQPVHGKNPHAVNPTRSVTIVGSDGSISTMPVKSSPFGVPAPEAPAPRVSNKRNNVDREPGSWRGEARDVPADSRFDTDHPGHLDTGSLA